LIGVGFIWLIFISDGKITKKYLFFVLFSHKFRNFGFAELTFRSEEQKKLRFSCYSLTNFVTLASPNLLFVRKNKKNFVFLVFLSLIS